MVDVVMLAYNFNEDLVELTRQAIYSVKGHRLILVDNASAMGGGMLREEADTYIRNKTNIGYPGAVNQGMALSQSPFVAISNNDVRVSSNWAGVAEEIFKDPTVGTVHFRMVPYDQPFELGSETYVGGKERWCTSSFFIIRQEAFQVYDDTYGAGGYDDYDHHNRMRSKGWKMAYTNKAQYQHMDSITYRTMEDQAKRAERDHKNREFYKSKHGEYPDIQFANDFPGQMLIPYAPFP